MNENASLLLIQLLPLTPLLLVYLVGMVLAIAYWQRSPSAALLVLIGTVMLFASVVLGTLGFHYVIRSRNDLQGGGLNYQTVLAAFNLFMTLLRTLATALLIAAAFVGRRAVNASTMYDSYPGKPEKVTG